VSERRACRVFGVAYSSQRYRSRRPPQEGLRQRLCELALERVRWGYRRLHLLLRREGVQLNIKRTYRLYREEGLAVRRRKRKRVAVSRQPLVTPRRVNECWAMDFMSDSLSSGRRYRVLNVVDVLSREGLASEADTSLPAVRVIGVLEQIALVRGYPARIVLDNGPEFRSTRLDAWAYAHGIGLEFIQPGKPIQNAVMESYKGRMRDELLNQHWWGSIAEARDAIDAYRQDFNQVRPHSALDNKTPSEFAQRYTETLNPRGSHRDLHQRLGAGQWQPPRSTPRAVGIMPPLPGPLACVWCRGAAKEPYLVRYEFTWTRLSGEIRSRRNQSHSAVSIVRVMRGASSRSGGPARLRLENPHPASRDRSACGPRAPTG